MKLLKALFSHKHQWEPMWAVETVADWCGRPRWVRVNTGTYWCPNCVKHGKPMMMQVTEVPVYEKTVGGPVGEK